jgi:antitoxin VapB
MSVRISNPAVITNIERLALATGQGKTAIVEAAIDRMLADLGEVDAPRVWSTFDAIVAQLHRLPPRADAFEAMAFDELDRPV